MSGVATRPATKRVPSSKQHATDHDSIQHNNFNKRSSFGAGSNSQRIERRGSFYCRRRDRCTRQTPGPRSRRSLQRSRSHDPTETTPQIRYKRSKSSQISSNGVTFSFTSSSRQQQKAAEAEREEWKTERTRMHWICGSFYVWRGPARHPHHLCAKLIRPTTCTVQGTTASRSRCGALFSIIRGAEHCVKISI